MSFSAFSMLGTAQVQLPSTLEERIDALECPGGKTLCEYVWVGTSGALRSQTKVLEYRPATANDVPVLVVSADEASCLEAGYAPSGHELFLKPRKLFKDPFRQGDHLLALCDTFMPPTMNLQELSAPPPPLQPHPSNHRVPAESVLRRAEASAPLFAVEQEYAVFTTGNPSNSSSSVSGPGSPHLGQAISKGTCSLQGQPVLQPAPTRSARNLAEAHLRHCLHAGLSVTGAGQGATAGVWNYSIGPCPGTDLGDQLWMSRHLLLRLAECHGLLLSFSPLGIGSGGSMGCYFKYSTAETRRSGLGLVAIQQHIGRLQTAHTQYIMTLGHSSLQRALSQQAGGNCVAQFTCGFGSKAASVVIPSVTAAKRCGYYIDRRPAANADPYTVVMLLTSTTLGIQLPTAVVQLVVAAQRMAAAALAAAAAAPQHSASPYGSLESDYTGGSCLSNGSLDSWGASSMQASSFDDDDLLVDELERYDRTCACSSATSAVDMDASICSDGTSPEAKDYGFAAAHFCTATSMKMR